MRPDVEGMLADDELTDHEARTLAYYALGLERDLARYKALHEAELGICEQHCDVVADLEHKLTVARDALERIRANNYGLQGLVEDGEPESKITEYFSGLVAQYQSIAQNALEELGE